MARVANSRHGGVYYAYPLRWKFMQAGGNPDKVSVNIPAGIVRDKEKLKFIITQNNTELAYEAGTTGDDINLTLMPPPTAGEYSILAVVKAPKGDKTWQLAGRLDILSRTPKTYNVTLVPLNGQVFTDSDKTAVSAYLNRTWKSYSIKWEVDVDEEFYVEVDDNDADKKRKADIDIILGSTWTDGDQFLSEYIPAQRDMNRLYNTYASSKSKYDDTHMYVFILPPGKAPYTGQIGDMPLKQQWGYLFVNNFGDEHYRTLSHELGHGRTALHHTFKDGYLDEGKTSNLMDYPSVDGQAGTDLVRAQWDQAHAPARFTPPQKDEDGAAENTILEMIVKVVKSNGANGCAFVRYKNESGTTGDNIKFDNNTIEYLAGKYESEEIVIVSGVGQPADIDAIERIKNKIKDGVFEFIVYVKPDGQIGICTPQEDYSMYSPSLLDFALDPGFLQKFKTDYLNCYNRSNIYNLTSESISEEQKQWLDKLFKGENPITYNGETYHSSSAFFIYSDETTSDTDKQFAETFTPQNGEIKIWVHRENGQLEFKSSIPDFAEEATGLTKTQVKEQIINQIFDDYSANLQGWDQLASSLYEFFDITRKRVRHFRIPEHVWDCNDSDIYRSSPFWPYSFFTAAVRDNGSKYKSMAGAALEYEFKQAFPGLKDAIEGLSEPEAEIAFYCGVWNGVVEVVASVADIGAFVTGALSADVVDDFRQTLIALNRYEGEDGKTGMWAAVENGLYQSVDGNCKLAELGGEIVFIVALAAVNPAAINQVQALTGPALANILRVLKAFDAIADALPGFAIKFAANGAASFFDDAGRLVARAVDGSFTGKALRLSDNAIVDLPPHKITDKFPTANNGKIEIEIGGQKYRLISKVESDIFELLQTVTHSIDATTIAKSRTALGAIANDLTDAQIANIIKMNYLASEKVLRPGETYLVTAEMLKEIREQLIKVSKKVGLPAQNEVCTKIVHLKYVNAEVGGFIPTDPNYRFVDGYIGRAKDFEAVSTDKLYKDYRLDYDNSPFTATKDTEGYAVYKFRNTEPGKVHNAYEFGSIESAPNTQCGFPGNDSRIMPEYKLEKRNFIDGDEMEIYDLDGKLKGTYEYKIDINVNGQIQTGWLKR